MMRAAEGRGAQLRLGRATGLLRRGEGAVGVRLEGEALEGDAVVVAMGPWSVLAAQWLALPPVFGLKGHSLVLDTGAAIPPEALFLECADAAGSALSPEVFPRADGTTYVCAVSSEPPLPVDPGLVLPDDGAVDRLKALCGRISPVLARSPVLASQACYRPVTQDGLPLVGAVPGVQGARDNRPAGPSSRTRLKSCLYGPLNRAQSSRRLERETQRNLELRWLTGRLTPDFKTIADPRKDNGPAIRATRRRFALLCRKLDLFSVGGAPQGAWEPWAGQAPQLSR